MGIDKETNFYWHFILPLFIHNFLLNCPKTFKLPCCQIQHCFNVIQQYITQNSKFFW
uniref:Uncharacterized protein n=1 Tax=Ciona intestinalis TaxID=7719 RepID=H2XL74_CIOIN